ncbi:MAG: glutamine--fructose-6-phosphate transaminase (isomerizing) [Defluviitaleaceae bacterium]|nr:glutamine--fructose-6-phosphate transaminase (isomerizing) [Defluviitaleaceae bacterium]
MCGIIGYIGEADAVPIIVEGLKRLEYRGYDSAGIAVYNSGAFGVVKRKGRIAELEASLENANIFGKLGIGHTRWATHGEPNDANSHPHLGEKSRIAVVHNGIIENYKEIKGWLQEKGVKFASQTDSEVVAQLCEHHYDGDLMQAVIKVANILEGSYALGIMCLDEPDILMAIKKDNPLIVGISDDGNFIASDVPAILPHTTKVHYLNDKEIAILTKDDVKFYNMDSETIHREAETITWTMEGAEKGGYPHFMLKEIMEQPRVIKETIKNTLMDGANKNAIDSLDISHFNKVVITACGSACYAGIVGKYVFERLCRISVEVEFASEFRYKDPIVDDKTLVIVVSQSGETADTIGAMREAKKRGATTFAIVNAVGSTIAREADFTAYTAAGPEIAVASTKAFSAQLVLLYILAIRFAQKLGKIDDIKTAELIDEINALPEKATQVLEHTDYIQKYAAGSINSKSVFFIGRNVDYAISFEGSLKLKEISYIHSEAYAGGELKHGTIALIEEGVLVVAISCCPSLYGKIFSNVEQVISRGARVLFVSTEDTKEDDKLSLIKLPPVHELFSPSLSVIVLQLFSYYVAANKGLDIDKPRNLAKSVTVE